MGPRVPEQALRESRTSIGSVVDVSRTLPPSVAHDLTSAAKVAFVHGSNVANVVGGVVVLVAAALAFRFMPRNRALTEEHEMELSDERSAAVNRETWAQPEAAPA